MNALMPAVPALTSLRKEMDRLFERAFDADLELPALSGWAPPLDLSESDQQITVRMEVPGIDPKDIQVLLKGQVLTVRGEKMREREHQDENFYRMERRCGAFARALELPSNVREDNVAATFKNGLLTITLTKVAEPAGKAIPIRTT